MNKILNPLMLWILRSPLHRMMSDSLLLVTYRGRKSGKEFTLPVQYVQDGETIFIVPGQAEKKVWWRSLRGGAQVRLVLKGKVVTGTAVVLEGPGDTERIAQGLVVYLRGFPAAAKPYNIRPAGDLSFNQDDLRRAASSLVMVMVSIAPVR